MYSSVSSTLISSFGSAGALGARAVRLRASGNRIAMPATRMGHSRRLQRSIDGDTHNFNTDPERIEFVALAFAEVIILIMPLLVVEADPDFFLVRRHLDL